MRKLLEKQSTKKRDEDQVTFLKSAAFNLVDALSPYYYWIQQVHVPTKPKLPHMRYINTTRGVADGCGLESSLSLPPGMDYPLATQKAVE